MLWTYAKASEDPRNVTLFIKYSVGQAVQLEQSGLIEGIVWTSYTQLSDSAAFAVSLWYELPATIAKVVLAHG